MIYALLVIAFFVGYYLQQIRSLLIKVLAKINELKIAQDKAKPPTTGFAEEMTRAEMLAELEADKIRMLNPK